MRATFRNAFGWMHMDVGGSWLTSPNQESLTHGKHETGKTLLRKMVLASDADMRSMQKMSDNSNLRLLSGIFRKIFDPVAVEFSL
jgi:hypothetical protein